MQPIWLQTHSQKRIYHIGVVLATGLFCGAIGLIGALIEKGSFGAIDVLAIGPFFVLLIFFMIAFAVLIFWPVVWLIIFLFEVSKKRNFRAIDLLIVLFFLGLTIAMVFVAWLIIVPFVTQPIGRWITEFLLNNESDGPIKGLIGGFIAGMVAGLITEPDKEVKPIETIKFSLNRVFYGMIGGFFFGIGASVFSLMQDWLDEHNQIMSAVIMIGWICGLIYGLLVRPINSSDKSSINRFMNVLFLGFFGGFIGTITGMIVQVFLGLIDCFISSTSCVTNGISLLTEKMASLGLFSLILGLAIGLIYGLIGPDIDIKRKTVPNQGIWQSTVNAGTFALVGGLVIGLIYGLRNGINGGLSFGLMGGMILGCFRVWLVFNISHCASFFGRIGLCPGTMLDS